MAVNSLMVELGTPAPDFSLPSVTTGEKVTLASFADASALLVVFMSNHCPYVRHVEAGFASFASEYQSKGLAVVAISANDVVSYPEDAPERLVDQIQRAGFTFPYLYDESQAVAREYRAACTPDFFLYDSARRLAYRGQFDDSRPKSTLEVTGDSLRAASESVLKGEAVPEPHHPSIGCSIKWRAGNEPE
ncbi:MAG TPA: thioredoxin family protein [Candidatus Limnocylindrales bacterium]|nr:thioredoxin family protein [Candidatus Limnocylindrales bacterium]